MNESFAPPVPQFQAPNQGDPNGVNGGPQFNNTGPGQESQSQWTRSVARSARIRSATSTIIKTRGQFKAYLQSNGMDLYTSAVEFQHTGDFILSSYILYSNYNNYKEPLAAFLQRYPTMQQPVIAIRDSLISVKGSMQVITPKLSQRGY
ncbi:MAG: hypothetical protein WCK98_05565 [bacterium]